MKLTKNKLIRLVREGLQALGYTYFKDTISGAQGLFCKRVNDDLYLSLGLNIHRYDDNQFTGTFYLSRTTYWGAVYGDIPRNSYERPGFLLTDEELSVYFEGDKMYRDVWWSSAPESVSGFIRVVAQTEARFTGQKDLVESVRNSEAVNRLALMARMVQGKIAADRDTSGEMGKDDIPAVWFQAAEAVLVEFGKKLYPNAIKGLAADAYRLSILNAMEL